MNKGANQPFVDFAEAPSTLAPKAQVASQILIVDDCEDSVELVRLLLESAGYPVHVAHDATEALLVLESCHENISLILTDIEMGGMNGWDLARTIRARYSGSGNIGILAFTADPERWAQEAAGEAIFNGCMAKPIDPYRFADSVHAVMETLSANKRAERGLSS